MQPLTQNFDVITFAERAAPEEIVDKIVAEGWPRFMLFDPVADRYWTRLHAYFPQFQFALYDEDMNIVAVGNSVPFAWDGQEQTLSDHGWDWVMETSVTGYEAGTPPTALSAISITMARGYAGHGLSQRVVNAMREIARQNNLRHLVAPVRPSRKSLYPLIPMERYIHWKTEDDEVFDPWMRVHARLGAQIIKVCPQSMNIPGSIDQWEEWSGMRLPESGLYIVPGALCPVEINVEEDRGVYSEPNVWMRHSF